MNDIDDYLFNLRFSYIISLIIKFTLKMVKYFFLPRGGALNPTYVNALVELK